ncbi:MAG: hypothetical protein ACI88H_002893 [Cocleimonas sp.]|jgi:hypothetical protein
MSLKLLNSLFLGLILMFSMPITTSVFACDNKGCESAYLAETQQHIANQIRRANAYKAERHAHSLNRERRAYAEFVHKYFVLVKDSA